MTRFFPPDQPFNTEDHWPWRVGDVLSFVHGPDPRNVFCMATTEVGPRGDHKRAELVDSGAFASEIAAFHERERTRLMRTLRYLHDDKPIAVIPADLLTRVREALERYDGKGMVVSRTQHVTIDHAALIAQIAALEGKS